MIIILKGTPVIFFNKWLLKIYKCLQVWRLVQKFFCLHLTSWRVLPHWLSRPNQPGATDNPEIALFCEKAGDCGALCGPLILTSILHSLSVFIHYLCQAPVAFQHLFSSSEVFSPLFPSRLYSVLSHHPEGQELWEKQTPLFLVLLQLAVGVRGSAGALSGFCVFLRPTGEPAVKIHSMVSCPSLAWLRCFFKLNWHCNLTSFLLWKHFSCLLLKKTLSDLLSC